MAKPKKAQPVGGPFVAAALFCEKLLQDKDGVLSIIRAVDVLTVHKPSELTLGPDGKPTVPVTKLWLVIMFKSGDATGEHTIKVDAVFPSGKIEPGAENRVNLLGGGNGATLHGEVPVDVSEEGLYWYDVFFDGERATRMPLQIVHQKPSPEAQPQSSETEPSKEPGPGKRKRSASRGDGGRKKL